MAKKKKVIIFVIAAITFLLLISASLYLLTESGPKKTVKEFALTSGAEAEKYLSENFLSEISNNATNETYLNEAVSDYSVSKEVKSVKITSETENSTTLELVLETTTTNKKTNFTVKTQDVYNVRLLQMDSTWKIDEYELKESKTIE